MNQFKCKIQRPHNKEYAIWPVDIHCSPTHAYCPKVKNGSAVSLVMNIAFVRIGSLKAGVIKNLPKKYNRTTNKENTKTKKFKFAPNCQSASSNENWKILEIQIVSYDMFLPNIRIYQQNHVKWLYLHLIYGI